MPSSGYGSGWDARQPSVRLVVPIKTTRPSGWGPAARLRSRRPRADGRDVGGVSGAARPACPAHRESHLDAVDDCVLAACSARPV